MARPRVDSSALEKRLDEMEASMDVEFEKLQSLISRQKRRGSTVELYASSSGGDYGPPTPTSPSVPSLEGGEGKKGGGGSSGGKGGDLLEEQRCALTPHGRKRR